MFNVRDWVAIVTAAAVLTGCASTATSPSATTSAASNTTALSGESTASTSLFGYQFRDGVVPSFEGSPGTLSRAAGIIAMPSGEGPFPVVIVVHGSYPQCIDAANDALLPGPSSVSEWAEVCGTKHVVGDNGLTRGPDYVQHAAGFSYLAESLARRGFAAVSIDVSAKESTWTGEVDARQVQTELLNRHMSLLADLHAGTNRGVSSPERFTGRLDMTRVALVGHSSGGGFVLDHAYSNKLDGVQAVVGLQPSVEPDVQGASATNAAVMVVSGECDEQVPAASVNEYAAAHAAANPASANVLVTLTGTTHIALVQGGGTHRVGMVQPVDSPACADDKLVAAADARSQAAQVVGDFLSAVFAERTDVSFIAASDARLTASAGTATATATVTVGDVASGETPADRVVFEKIDRDLLDERPADLKIYTG